MNKTTEALKLAEEALEKVKKLFRSMTADECPDDPYISVGEALAAIREALAEPVKQEPIGEVDPYMDFLRINWKDGRHPPKGTKLYAAPVSAKREWVYLTDDEIDELIRKWYSPDMGLLEFAWAVIVAFEDKNK